MTKVKLISSTAKESLNVTLSIFLENIDNPTLHFSTCGTSNSAGSTVHYSVLVEYTEN